MEKMEYTNKVITNGYFANRMFKSGHKLVDFKPNKFDRSKTVFVFELDETFEEDLNDIIEESNRRRESRVNE